MWQQFHVITNYQLNNILEIITSLITETLFFVLSKGQAKATATWQPNTYTKTKAKTLPAKKHSIIISNNTPDCFVLTKG